MEQNLLDELTGALVGLAKSTYGNEHLVSDSTTAVLLEGLLKTAANPDCCDDSLSKMIERVTEEKRKLVPNCFYCVSPCGKTTDYDMKKIWNADKNIYALKSSILFGIRELAAYAYHAFKLGHQDPEINQFFCKALFAIGMDDWNEEELLSVVLDIGGIHRKCIMLLAEANTKNP